MISGGKDSGTMRGREAFALAGSEKESAHSEQSLRYEYR